MAKVSSRQSGRLERKKKKLAALLDLAELNEKDRIKQEKIGSELNLDDRGGTDEIIGSNMIGAKKKIKSDEGTQDEGPKRKRQKSNGESQTSLDSSKISDKPSIEEVQTANAYNMSMDEYKQLKKDLKERKNMLKVIPRILLNETGNQADVHFSCRVPMFMSDIQHFIMYSQLGHDSPVKARWCDIEKFNRIPHTVILIIEGLSVYDLLSNESSCPNFADLKLKVEFLSPFNYNGILIEELAAVPLTKSQMHNFKKSLGGIRNKNSEIRVLRSIFPVQIAEEENFNNNQPDIAGKEMKESVALSNSDQFSRTDLLLSAWQMVEAGYPIPLKGELKNRYADYVMTKDEYTEVTPSSPMWGIDCEMCLTKVNKNELTRISIVDENFKTVYDTLVKPRNQIVNYLTQFSGITKKMLEDVTTTLEDVQEDLRRLLPSNVILVGQSLNFDLHALKMMHPYIIDTSIIYNLSGVRSRKTKLAVLTAIFLNEVIQAGHGHDSVEDSLSALKLVKLKLENSIDFGDAVLSGPLCVDQPFKQSIDETHVNKTDVGRNSKPRRTKTTNEAILFTSLFSYAVKNDGKQAAVIADESILSNYETYVKASTFKEDESDLRVKSVPVKKNKTAIKKTCEQAGIQSFVLTHLKLDKNESIQDVDGWCGDIFKSLAYNSLFAVILAGCEESEAHGAFMLTIKRQPMFTARYNIKSNNS